MYIEKNITFKFLQSKYRKDRTIKFPITIAYNLTGWNTFKTSKLDKL